MGFKKQREKSGFRQEEVAHMLGINRTTIAKWETGRSLPRAELLPLIAKIYKCKINDLLEKEVHL